MTPSQNHRRTVLQAMSVALAVSLALTLPQTASADDWTQWRGEGRLGVWSETGILESFPESGLEIRWRAPLRNGYSGPSVSEGRVFVMDWVRKEGSRRIDGTERLVALDEATGELLWEREWEADYSSLMGSYAIGPRATPTVADGRVFAVGAVGDLVVTSAEDGAVLWQKDYKELGAQIATWGVTSAPLIVDGLVITIAGAEPEGKVVAFDEKTGEEVWRALSSDWEMGYGQPVLIESGGERQVVIWEPHAIHGLDPATGEIFWSVPWDVAYGMTVATPVLEDDRLVVSQFYRGSLMLGLSEDRPEVEVLWKGMSKSEMPDQTDGLHAMITTPVLQEGVLYGVGSYGELRGLDAATGERLWENKEMTRQGRWGTAFFVKNGNRWFMNNDHGELLIVALTPEGPVEIDRTKLIEPTSDAGIGPRRAFDAKVNWSHPAYANGHIIARNDKEILSASLLAPGASAEGSGETAGARADR